MTEHKQTERRPGARVSHWSSRARPVLIGFLLIAGLLLAFEHRAHIFTGNGLLIALLGACIVMHLFMHGGHGGHGGGHDQGEK